MADYIPETRTETRFLPKQGSVDIEFEIMNPGHVSVSVYLGFERISTRTSARPSEPPEPPEPPETAAPHNVQLFAPGRSEPVVNETFPLCPSQFLYTVDSVAVSVRGKWRLRLINLGDTRSFKLSVSYPGRTELKTITIPVLDVYGDLSLITRSIQVHLDRFGGYITFPSAKGTALRESKTMHAALAAGASMELAFHVANPGPVVVSSHLDVRPRRAVSTEAPELPDEYWAPNRIELFQPGRETPAASVDSEVLPSELVHSPPPTSIGLQAPWRARVTNLGIAREFGIAATYPGSALTFKKYKYFTIGEYVVDHWYTPEFRFYVQNVNSIGITTALSPPSWLKFTLLFEDLGQEIGGDLKVDFSNIKLTVGLDLRIWHGKVTYPDEHIVSEFSFGVNIVGWPDWLISAFSDFRGEIKNKVESQCRLVFASPELKNVLCEELAKYLVSLMDGRGESNPQLYGVHVDGDQLVVSYYSAE